MAYVVAGYGVTLVSLAAYTAFLWRRGRTLSRRPPARPAEDLA